MQRLVLQLILCACLTMLLGRLIVSTVGSIRADATDASLERSPSSVRAGTRSATPEAPPMPMLDAYKQTLARPAFVDGRRPPEAGLPPPPPAPPPAQLSPPRPATSLERWRLLGVHIDGDSRRALIQPPDKAATWLELGKSIGEWTLTVVSSDVVELTTQGRTGQLKLYPR